MNRLLKVIAVSGLMAALFAPIALADEGAKAPLAVAGKSESSQLRAVEGSKASPIRNKAIVFGDRSNPNGFWERFSINARGCQVREGAIIQVRDNDGTVAYVQDNRGTSITSTPKRVIGEGRLGGNDVIGFFVTKEGDGFMDKRATVVGSSRIFC